MEQKEFDWFEDTTEVDTPEFAQQERIWNITKQTYDCFVLFSKYAVIFTLLLLAFRGIFRYNKFKIAGINLNTILFCTLISSLSMLMIEQLMSIITRVIRIFRSEEIEAKFLAAYTWISFSLYYFCNLTILKYFTVKYNEFEILVKAYLQCGLLFSSSFAILTLIIESFNKYFIEKKLKIKIMDVDVRERILAAMKAYRYEANSSSAETTDETPIKGIFSWFTSNNVQSEEDLNEEDHINIKKISGQKIGNLYFKKPEITTLTDAKTLSRDVFLCAAQGEERLSFTKFSDIFPSIQIAIQAYQFFDPDNDRKIGKKEFRDTIIGFYVERCNLEKSFHILKGFVSLIEDFVRIVVLALNILGFLILFGVPLKELTALALSSALLINFMASGVASEIYRTFMMVTSHPYDVGDDIIIDGNDYKVYKIGIASTSFIGTNGGKVKFLNSSLWKKNLINMTRAPEKILVFQFNLSKNLSIAAYNKLKEKIHLYLRTRPFDFFEVYNLEAKSEQAIDINYVECHLILKCKSYKTKGKKFLLRVEVTKMLRDMIKDLGIGP